MVDSVNHTVTLQQKFKSKSISIGKYFKLQKGTILCTGCSKSFWGR